MKKKIGLGLLTFLPLFAATVETRACIGHLMQEQWPPHEMFHLLMGLSGLLATYALIQGGVGSASKSNVSVSRAA